ncbi:hypothetical protein AVEN_137755-1, partial [Araneus ventricosus]
EIVKTDRPDEIHFLAFAAYFAFVIIWRTRRKLEQSTNLALESFKIWTDENEFDIQEEKSQYFLTD